MRKFGKIWLFLLGTIMIFWLNFQYVQWAGLSTRDHYDNSKTWSQWEERFSTWKVGNEYISSADPIWSWSSLMSKKSTWILHLPQRTNYEWELWYLLAIIQIAVNWILGILASVVLVYTLYCWFLILSSWSDDKNVSKGKKWIKTAAIAIAWIWLAWLIISVMIWFIRVVTDSDL